MSAYRVHIDLYSCTKLKLKWITDLNIKPDTLNMIEKKVGNSLECIGTGGNFLNRTLITQALRSTTINKWDLMKCKCLCKAKSTINRTKQQPT